MDKSLPKAKTKKFLLIAACLLVSIILIVVLIYKIRVPDTFKDPIKEFEVFQTKENESVIFIDGKECEYKIPNTDGNTVFTFDLGMSKLFILNRTGDLFLINNLNHPKKIDEKVVSFKVSANGKYVAYINSDKNLILKDVDSNKSKLIRDKLDNTLAFEISPSGKSIVYADKQNLNEAFVYVNTNGKERKLAEKMFPIAVNDDASSIYLISPKEELYYLKPDKNEKKNKLIKLSDVSLGKFPIFFNNSMEEVVFSNEHGTFYFSEEEKNAKKILDEESAIMIPKLKAGGYSNLPDQKIVLSTSTVLKNYYYSLSNTIYYIDNVEHSKKLASKVTQAEITDNLDSLFYIDSDKNLYKLFKRDPENKQLLAKDCYSFISNSSGTAYYYIDKHNDLYYSYKNKEPEKYAEKTINAMLNKDGTLIYTKFDKEEGVKGTVFVVKPGSEPKEIAKNASGVLVSGKLYAYFVPKYDGDEEDIFKDPIKYFNELVYELYTSNDGVEFTKNDNLFKLD
ncbi:MAG: hypothetical protein Q4E28_03650 [Clostridia bacterium]|nr:hypothetical protein [Clostridia bacterium]